MKRKTIALGACLVVLAVAIAGSVLATSGAANPAQAGVPQSVSDCLQAGSDRGACFAAASAVGANLSAPAAVGGRVPSFVAKCLAQPPADRGACFAERAPVGPVESTPTYHIP